MSEQDPLAPAPVEAAPAAPVEPVVPDWLRDLPPDELAAPAAPSDLPEWLRAPGAPLPPAPTPELALPPFPAPDLTAPGPSKPETEAERVARLKGQVQIEEAGDKDKDSFIVFEGIRSNFGTMSTDEILRYLKNNRSKVAGERFGPEWTDENLDYAIAELEARMAAKEAEAGVEVAVGEKKAEVSGLTEEEAAQVWETQFVEREKDTAENLRRLIAIEEEQILTSGGRIKNFSSYLDKRAIMPADEYIARLKQILAKKETEAAKGAEPAAVSFAAKVEAARGLVAGAVGEAGGLSKEVAEQQGRVAETTAGLEIPAIPREGIESSKKTRVEELSAEEIKNLEAAREAMKRGGFPTNDLDEMITIQRQYRLGQEMAVEANKKYGAELAAAAKELKPGWFEKEPAVVREMAELQEFFDRTGNVEKLQQTKAEIEEEKGTRMWRNGGVKENYKREREAELNRVEDELATLGSADKFIGRKDMPKVLREVIAARRAGREFNFGTGPVAEFRRRVYESVMGTLGVEAAPAVESAVEVVEAAAPVAPAPTPELKSAAAEPKPAAVPEKKVEPTAEPVAEKMKQPLSTFAKDLIAARELKDERKRNKAFARATGEAQERLVRGFTDNPQGLRDELAGLPEEEQKQLLKILVDAKKGGKADPRLERFTKGLLEKKGLSAAEISAGALGIFGTIIEWITGIAVDEFMAQMKSK